MDYIGIDVHASESQICALTEPGEILERRVRTRPDRFAEVLGERAWARILIEASTESEWVARCLEDLGHEVIVADPNYAPMYATRSRRVKTDRRDARALMDACRLGAYRPAHRTSDAQRQVRAELAVHDPQIEAADARLATHAAADPVVRRLETVPNIGPVTALSFVATLDCVERFRGPHPAAAYLGLVPGERSSGGQQRRGPITNRGNSRTRWLLVEAAWGVIRHAHPDTAELRTWATRVAARRRRRIAAVALARRLAGILYAMWRDETDYVPQRAMPPQETALAS